jgi:hypothetical protein
VARTFTNGIDYKPYMGFRNGSVAANLSTAISGLGQLGNLSNREGLVAALPDLNFLRTAIDLPPSFVPTSPNLTGSNDATHFTMLSNTSVGVMMLGSFHSSSPTLWRRMVTDGIANLKAQGADHLLIDVTNNPGGYICAQFLVSSNQDLCFSDVSDVNSISDSIDNSCIDCSLDHQSIGILASKESFVPMNWPSR